MIKIITWNQEKDKLLKSKRGIGFQEIVDAMNNGGLLDTLEHFNLKKYPNQRFFVVEIKNYVYVVPFVENGEKIFLKTVYPSRDYKKLYTKNNL